MCQMTSSQKLECVLQEFHSERPNSPFRPRQKECLWYICTWGTHTNTNLWWNTWKNCYLVTRERKLAMDIITYMWGTWVGPEWKPSRWIIFMGHKGNLRGTQSIFCIHSCTHSCLKFLSQPTLSNNHVLSALLFTLRRKPSGNWVISIFSGQKPCTRIIFKKQYQVVFYIFKGRRYN